MEDKKNNNTTKKQDELKLNDIIDTLMLLEKRVLDLTQEINNNEIILRVNNLLLSKFILQLSNTRKELGLPKRQTFFRFEILDDEYRYLCDKYGKDETEKALYRLDRLLIKNKQNCPNNIKRYIENRLRKRKTVNRYDEEHE